MPTQPEAGVDGCGAVRVQVGEGLEGDRSPLALRGLLHLQHAGEEHPVGAEDLGRVGELVQPVGDGPEHLLEVEGVLVVGTGILVRDPHQVTRLADLLLLVTLAHFALRVAERFGAEDEEEALECAAQDHLLRGEGGLGIDAIDQLRVLPGHDGLRVGGHSAVVFLMLTSCSTGQLLH